MQGANVHHEDEGDISGDEDEASGGSSTKQEGAAKLAQMQMSKMQREIAAMEAKMGKAHATKERLEHEQRALKDKLESGRLSGADAQAALAEMEKIIAAKDRASDKEKKLGADTETMERLQTAIATADNSAAIEAAVAQALNASAEQKQHTVAEADDGIKDFINQENALRAELAKLEEQGGAEDEENALREALMDVERNRGELVTVRENAAADLVLEQFDAAEMGVELSVDTAGATSWHGGLAQPEEPMDVYTVRQYERTVERLRQRADTHRSNVTRDKSRATVLSKEIREMKAEVASLKLDGSPQLCELAACEVELGSLGFHEAHEQKEMKASAAWIVGLEDKKRSGEGVLLELLAYFTERKLAIKSNIVALGLEAQRNGKEEGIAREELVKADDATKPERERKLGALEAQRVKLVELHLALSDEITFCTAEIVEMQSKHGAQVAIDSSERAQKLASERYCIQNHGFCIKNDGFCIKNDEVCIEMMNFVLNMSSKAEIERQLAEQKLALQVAGDRKTAIGSAEIKLQAAMLSEDLSERDRKDAELQLRDLESERSALESKKLALIAQTEELTKAAVEFDAASKAAAADGAGTGSVAVRKLVEQQLMRSEASVRNTQAELDMAEVEATRLEALASSGSLDTIEMESVLRHKELLEAQLKELSHSLSGLEDEARVSKAHVSDMKASEIETAEAAESGGGGENHRANELRAELEFRNKQADEYAAKIAEYTMREEMLSDQLAAAGGEPDAAIAAEVQIITVEKELTVELRHKCAAEIAELNTLVMEHTQLQEMQLEIEELTASIDGVNASITTLHKEELGLRRQIESGILSSADLQAAKDRMIESRSEASDLETSRHESSLEIERVQEALTEIAKRATIRHDKKMRTRSLFENESQLGLRRLQKEEAQLMAQLSESSGSVSGEVEMKLGKLAVEREKLTALLAAEADVRGHVAEKHDEVITKRISIHHMKQTGGGVTEGYDQSMLLTKPGSGMPNVASLSGTDPAMQAQIDAANRRLHGAEGQLLLSADVSKNEELIIKNEELIIKNEELCIKNDESCRPSSRRKRLASCVIMSARWIWRSRTCDASLRHSPMQQAQGRRSPRRRMCSQKARRSSWRRRWRWTK